MNRNGEGVYEGHSGGDVSSHIGSLALVHRF
jgi:hypothetical protein